MLRKTISIGSYTPPQTSLLVINTSPKVFQATLRSSPYAVFFKFTRILMLIFCSICIKHDRRQVNKNRL